MESLAFRFANIFHSTNISNDKIMDAVNKVKRETSLDIDCASDGLYYGGDVVKMVDAVEQKLDIKSPSQRFDNITEKNLKQAADIFMHLDTCPGELKSWFLFYKYLFQEPFADQIILTLNRMMKVSKRPQHQYFKSVAKTLFKKTTQLLSLKYEEIQTLVMSHTKNISSTVKVKAESWNEKGMLKY